VAAQLQLPLGISQQLLLVMATPLQVCLALQQLLCACHKALRSNSSNSRCWMRLTTCCRHGAMQMKKRLDSVPAVNCSSSHCTTAVPQVQQGPDGAVDMLG
jgi:hypothetical protein